MRLRPSRTLSELADYAVGVIKSRLAELGSPELPWELEVVGDGGTVIQALAPIEALEPGCLGFATSRAYLKRIEDSEAAAVILPPSLDSKLKPFIRAHQPKLVFSVILELVMDDPTLVPARPEGVRFKDRSRVKIGQDVVIGDWSYVGADVNIGRGCLIYPQVFIDDQVTLGPDCVIFPRVTIFRNSTLGRKVILHSGVVIGDDGFGFSQVEDPDRGRLHHLKNEHPGGVIVGDFVEVGSQTCIDRGMAGMTVIGAGTKIDNHVQIGHNVKIGRECIIAGQAAMAGNSRLGDQVFLMGNAGVVDGTAVGDRAFLGAKSLATTDLPAGQRRWAGVPAQEADLEWKTIALSRKELPRLRELLRLLKKADSFEELKTSFFKK